MTLIIAGIEKGNTDYLTLDQGFCVSDGLGSLGPNQIFSADREKLNVLTPIQRIGTGSIGSIGYQILGRLRPILVAQAGAAALTSQVVAKYARKLEALYICYRRDDDSDAERFSQLESSEAKDRALCLRHIDDRSAIYNLPTRDDLPVHEEPPQLSMGYAAHLLATTFESTFTEVLSHDPDRANRRYDEYFSELLLMGVDWPEKKIRLFKFTPMPVVDPHGPPKISVTTQESDPNSFAVIGCSLKFRIRLTRGLQTAVSRYPLSHHSLARNTILKICAKTKLKGVGGQVREALCDDGGVNSPSDVPKLPASRPKAERRVAVDWSEFTL